MRAGPRGGASAGQGEEGRGVCSSQSTTSGTNMSAYRKRVEGVGSKGRPVFPFKVLCS